MTSLKEEFYLLKSQILAWIDPSDQDLLDPNYGKGFQVIENQIRDFIDHLMALSDCDEKKELMALIKEFYDEMNERKDIIQKELSLAQQTEQPRETTYAKAASIYKNHG